MTSSAPSSARGQCSSAVVNHIKWLLILYTAEFLHDVTGQTSNLANYLRNLNYWRQRIFCHKHRIEMSEFHCMNLITWHIYILASPLLSDKHKHSRENSCLSPRERPCSAIYPTPLETSQVRSLLGILRAQIPQKTIKAHVELWTGSVSVHCCKFSTGFLCFYKQIL